MFRPYDEEFSADSNKVGLGVGSKHEYQWITEVWSCNYWKA